MSINTALDSIDEISEGLDSLRSDLNEVKTEIMLRDQEIKRLRDLLTSEGINWESHSVWPVPSNWKSAFTKEEIDAYTKDILVPQMNEIIFNRPLMAKWIRPSHDIQKPLTYDELKEKKNE